MNTFKRTVPLILLCMALGLLSCVSVPWSRAGTKAPAAEVPSATVDADAVAARQTIRAVIRATPARATVVLATPTSIATETAAPPSPPTSVPTITSSATSSATPDWPATRTRAAEQMETSVAATRTALPTNTPLPTSTRTPTRTPTPTPDAGPPNVASHGVRINNRCSSPLVLVLRYPTLSSAHAIDGWFEVDAHADVVLPVVDLYSPSAIATLYFYAESDDPYNLVWPGAHPQEFQGRALEMKAVDLVANSQNVYVHSFSCDDPKIGGTWRSNLGDEYVIVHYPDVQEFTWQQRGSSEIGRGTIDRETVFVAWSGGGSASSIYGTVTAVDARGAATRIQWNNDVVFSR